MKLFIISNSNVLVKFISDCCATHGSNLPKFPCYFYFGKELCTAAILYGQDLSLQTVISFVRTQQATLPAIQMMMKKENLKSLLNEVEEYY